MLEDFKAYELGIKGASNKEEKDMFIDLLKDEIKEAEGKVDAETQKLIDKLKELYLGAKKKEIPKVEKKEIPKVEKKPKAKTTKTPRAKTTPEQKAKNRVKVQNATGKTIEECKEILAKYEALRGKTTQKDKQRVEKLKDEDKIIDGTNVKTADAITETTAKQVPKKIKQEVDAIEKEAEQEAIEQVKKESKKFYLAFFNKKKLEIEADSLYDAKQKAVEQFSVPKSKMGLLAVKLASKQEVKIEEVKKKEVEKIKIEKIEEKVKDMTKDLADKSNELIDAMTNTIKKLSPSKDEAIKFLMDIRNHVDVLLKANKANKFQLGGSVQSYDIAWAGGGRPMPMFKKGGKLKANSMPHSLYKNLTNQDVEVFRNMEYSEEEIKETNDRQGRGSQFANTPVNPFFNTYSKGGKFADGGIVNKRFLENQTSSYRDRILKSIANHYGTTTSAIKEELYDKDAEMIYEYIGNDRGLRMKVYEDMQNYSKGGKFADGGMVNSNGEHYTYFEYVAKDDYLQDTIYFVKIGINEDEEFGGELVADYDGITIDDIREMFGNQIAQRVANGYGRDYEEGNYRSKVIFVNNGLYKKGGKFADGGKIKVSVGEKEFKGYPVYLRYSGYPTETVSFHKSKELAEKKANLLRRKNKFADGGMLKLKDGTTMRIDEWYQKMEDKMGFEKFADRILKDSQFSKMKGDNNEYLSLIHI